MGPGSRPGPFGPLARALFGPWALLGPFGPWARALFGPGSGPGPFGPVWAQGALGPMGPAHDFHGFTL